MEYETYIMAKQIINKEINSIDEETQPIHNKNIESMMMLLVAITKLIITKQEIAYKDKKNQTITNLLPENEIKNMVKRGIFKIYDTPIDLERTTHQEKKIKIIDINEEKKNDYGWIIDNIRDSLAHNKYKINFEKQAIEINNTLGERKLMCEIDFYWLIRLSFVLSNTRIENNTKTLKLTPYIYQKEQNKEQIKNINDLNKLYKPLNTCMIELILKDDIKETTKIKKEIRKIWEEDIEKVTEKDKEFLMEKWNEMLFNNKHYDLFFALKQKKLKERIEKITKYCNGMKKIEYDGKEIKEYVDNKIKQMKTFTQLDANTQNEIFIKLIGQQLFNYDQKQTKIEDGLDMIMNHEFSFNNKKAQEYYMKNQFERIIEQLCYKEEKLLSALYLLGTINFLLHKEKIYDSEIDYKTIDTKNIIKMDIIQPERLEKEKEQTVDQLFKKLEYIKQILKKINKLNKNIEKNEEKILPQLKKEIQRLKTEQEKINRIKKILQEIKEKQKSIKTINNIKYIEVDNKELMRHLRNALAHTWIYYEDNNPNIMERIVEIRDHNDSNKITFKAQAPYKEWLNLFNNKIFEDTIKKYSEETYEHTLKL